MMIIILKKRMIRHLWMMKEELSRVECSESRHKRVIFQRGLVKEKRRAIVRRGENK
jgi:hypothetical protein